MKKHIFFGLVILIALIVSVVLYAQKVNQISKQNNIKPTSQAAWYQSSIKGHHEINVTKVGFPDYTNIKSLAEDSPIIVIGTPQQTLTKLVPPKDTIIITKYMVAVSDVIKGSIQNNIITINVLGGRIQFDNGTSAEMKMPEGWKSPQIGVQYVFFLMRRGNNYALVGGPQGLFALVDNRIVPQAQDESQLMQNNKGKNATAFFNELKQSNER